MGDITTSNHQYYMATGHHVTGANGDASADAATSMPSAAAYWPATTASSGDYGSLMSSMHPYAYPVSRVIAHHAFVSDPVVDVTVAVAAPPLVGHIAAHVDGQRRPTQFDARRQQYTPKRRASRLGHRCQCTCSRIACSSRCRSIRTMRNRRPSPHSNCSSTQRTRRPCSGQRTRLYAITHTCSISSMA